MWSNAIFPENTENYGFETGVKGCINDPKLHFFLHHSVVPCYLELEMIPIVSEISEGLETLDFYPVGVVCDYNVYVHVPMGSNAIFPANTEHYGLKQV